MGIKILTITGYLFVLVTMPLLYAADEGGGVRRHGVIYNIADDRKIIKIGGRYEPEGVDKYIKRHLDILHKEMTVLLQKMESLEKKMDRVKNKIERVNNKLDQIT